MSKIFNIKNSLFDYVRIVCILNIIYGTGIVISICIILYVVVIVGILVLVI